MKRFFMITAAMGLLLAVPEAHAKDVSGIKNLEKALRKPAKQLAYKLTGKVCVLDFSESGDALNTSEFGQAIANLLSSRLSEKKTEKFKLLSRYELVKLMRDSVIFGDSDTIGRLTKEAGMDILVTGDYSSQASDVLISVKAIEAKSGRMISSTSVLVKKTPDIEKMMLRKYRQFAAPPAQPDAAASVAKDLAEMETGVYYEGGDGKLYPVREGMVLTSSDNYSIYFKPKQKCYVYIVQVDSSNKAVKVFPANEFKTALNPVEGGKEYWVPNENEYLYLDNNPGREELFIFATKLPAPELENLKNGTGVAVEEAIRTMGIGGTRASELASKVKDTQTGRMQLITRKLIADGDFYYRVSFIHR